VEPKARYEFKTVGAKKLLKPKEIPQTHEKSRGSTETKNKRVQVNFSVSSFEGRSKKKEMASVKPKDFQTI